MDCSCFSKTLGWIIRLFIWAHSIVLTWAFPAAFFLHGTAFIVFHKLYFHLILRIVLHLPYFPLWLIIQKCYLISICLSNSCGFFCYWFLVLFHCDLIICIAKFSRKPLEGRRARDRNIPFQLMAQWPVSNHPHLLRASSAIELAHGWVTWWV